MTKSGKSTKKRKSLDLPSNPSNRYTPISKIAACATKYFFDKIVMQNPGRFILDANELRNRVLSMPRNPSIIRFFRHPKLSENAGYGIDKFLKWETLTGKSVTIDSDLLISTVTYPLATSNYSRKDGENCENNCENPDAKKILALIKETPSITRPKIAEATGFSHRKVNMIISALRKKHTPPRIVARAPARF